MTNKPQITKQDFDSLLSWLSPEADEAAVLYEKIRRGLIRFFRFRGCFDAESLTDETFNRVAKKVATTEFDANFDKQPYFYSFARRIFLEDYAKRRKQESKKEEIKIHISRHLKSLENEKNPPVECLSNCLAKESPQTSNLLLEYYGGVKGEKRQLRKTLAKEQNINLELLHTRVSRLKSGLRNCIKNCLMKKDY